MAIKIRSIKKMVENTGIKILVHGPAGAGKTVLAATAGEPTLILSAEAGLLSIKDAPAYVKATLIESIQDLREAHAWLLQVAGTEDQVFQWVCLDSITEIAEQVLSYEKANSKDPRAAYMTMQDEIGKILRDFRDLPGYDIYMSCKQERVDDEGKKIYAPMMPGSKLAQQIPYMFDEVFALRVEVDEDKQKYRVLQTSRDAKYEAKDRSGLLDEFEKPSLKRIKKKIKGEAQKPEEKPKGESKVEVEQDDPPEVEKELPEDSQESEAETEVEIETEEGEE